MHNLCLFHFLSHLIHLFLHLYEVLFLYCVSVAMTGHICYDDIEYPVEFSVKSNRS